MLPKGGPFLEPRKMWKQHEVEALKLDGGLRKYFLLTLLYFHIIDYL